MVTLVSTTMAAAVAAVLAASSSSSSSVGLLALSILLVVVHLDSTYHVLHMAAGTSGTHTSTASVRTPAQTPPSTGWAGEHSGSSSSAGCSCNGSQAMRDMHCCSLFSFGYRYTCWVIHPSQCFSGIWQYTQPQLAATSADLLS